MTSKTFPWTWVDETVWSSTGAYIRGWRDGLPLLTRRCAPRAQLATYRQLRARGLRPGGADPVAVLFTKHTGSGACNWSSLWLVDRAVPVRPMTPARWASIDRALAARRRCGQCGEDTGVYLRSWQRGCCDPCRAELGGLAADDELHEYLTGDLVASAAELAELAATTAADVTDLIPAPRTEAPAGDLQEVA